MAAPIKVSNLRGLKCCCNSAIPCLSIAPDPELPPRLERADRARLLTAGNQCLGFDDFYDSSCRCELSHLCQELMSKPV